MVCACKGDDWYGIDPCHKLRKIIPRPTCGTTLHYNGLCWYCSFHPPQKLKWIDLTFKNVYVVNLKRCANVNTYAIHGVSSTKQNNHKLGCMLAMSQIQHERPHQETIGTFGLTEDQDVDRDENSTGRENMV